MPSFPPFHGAHAEPARAGLRPPAVRRRKGGQVRAGAGRRGAARRVLLDLESAHLRPGRRAPADGVLPDGFFSTSNLPTYVRVGARWLLPARPRMDGVIVRRGDALETVERRLVRRGEPIAMGLAEDRSEE